SKDDTADVPLEQIMVAAVEAYHRALQALGLQPGSSFSISTLGDGDGDSDADGTAALFSIYDGNADWYTLVQNDGSKIVYAEVVAYYWYEDDCFYCSETYTEAITKQQPPVTKEERHEVIKRAVLSKAAHDYKGDGGPCQICGEAASGHTYKSRLTLVAKDAT